MYVPPRKGEEVMVATWYLVLVLGMYDMSGSVAIPQLSQQDCEDEVIRLKSTVKTAPRGGVPVMLCVKGVK